MRSAVSIVVLLVCWSLASVASASALLPSPVATLRELMVLAGEGEAFRHVLISLLRGTSGLALSLFAALMLGIPCGLFRAAMDFVSPILAAVQACPSILWISVLMVWMGLGGVVPPLVVFVAVFPALFLNVAEGTASIDRRLFQMADLYGVGRVRILRRIVVPGMASHLASGLSFSLGIAWKVTATAEYIASSSGIGSEIYWAFRMLNMPRLFCWGFVLVAFGMAVDYGLARRLRLYSRGQKGLDEA